MEMPSQSALESYWKPKDIRFCARENINWNDELRADRSWCCNSFWTSSSEYRVIFMVIIMPVGCVNFCELAQLTLPAMIYFKDVLVIRNCRLHKPLINIIICVYFSAARNENTCNSIHARLGKSRLWVNDVKVRR